MRKELVRRYGDRSLLGFAAAGRKKDVLKHVVDVCHTYGVPREQVNNMQVVHVYVLSLVRFED